MPQFGSSLAWRVPIGPVGILLELTNAGDRKWKVENRKENREMEIEIRCLWGPLMVICAFSLEITVHVYAGKKKKDQSCGSVAILLLVT